MAEFKTPSIKEMAKEIADKALDEFEYKGMTIRQWADKITSGEYKPVVRGWWVYHNFDTICSNCNKSAFFNGEYGYQEETNFCPNCGAEMYGSAHFEK